MGKNTSYYQKKVVPKREGMNPIWRGVGFGLLVIIPIMSYAGMELLLQYNAQKNLFPLPLEIINKGGPDPLLYIKIIIFFFILFVLFTILVFATFLINKFFAPSRYGPFDIPPVAYKRRKR
jgi:hypothetical protein